jgi:hypothetical protein
MIPIRAPALLLVALLAPTLSSAETPRRQAGLWEIAVTVSGQPTPSVGKHCIDAAGDDLALTAGGGVPQKDCKELHTLPGEGGFTLQSICKLGNSTVTTSGRFQGDLQTSYSGELEAKYSPPLYGRSEVKSRIQARWLGPCIQ